MTEKPAHGQTKKHLKEIILLFSVPAAVIAITVAFLYIPRLFAHPEYDFIYCEGYYCDSRFSVDADGRISELQDEPNRYSYHSARLYYYDLERDASRPIQTVDAARYLVDPSSKSPDGYALQRRTNSGGFLFWSESRDNWSLQQGLKSKPVTLNSYDVKFIGWVLKNG